MRTKKITIVTVFIMAATYISLRAGVIIHQLPIDWGVEPDNWLMITSIAFVGAAMLFVACHLTAKVIKIIGNELRTPERT